MPFVRPTLADLVTRIRGDFRGRLGITGSLLRRAMADVMAVVFGGAVHMNHGHLDWLADQLFANTAIAEFLLRKAGMHGITPTAAEFASGTVEATGTNGTAIPMSTVYVRDDGATFTTTALATIAAGVASVSLIADVAGSDGNMDTADTLSLQSPISGINTDATVETPGITGGIDEEIIEDLRTRFLLRLREPPQGGSDQDYEAWALAEAGVTRAWIYRHESGLGTLTVRFVLDGETSIFPTAGQVTSMQTALDAERPTTAEVTAAAPVDLPVAFTITVTPDTTAIRTAVEAELADLFYRDQVPGDGVALGTILLSAMRTAIGVSEGVTDYTLTAPAADVVPALGELPTLGVVTWV